MAIKTESRMTAEQEREQERLEATARELAELLDRALNPGMHHRRDYANRATGFALLLFAFGDAPQPATYISNGSRGDMIRALEEWLERAKSRQ